MAAALAAALVRAMNRWTGAIPHYDGNFNGDGLGLDDAAAAQILRDDHGIPTVIAATANDTFALHGVCVGQDRLWQLHQTRMAAHGRLAEIKAPALKFDVFARQIGFGRLGAEDWEAMLGQAEHAESVQMIEAFLRGINWAAGKRRAHGEMFVLTGAKWEALTPQELCGMARLVSFFMSSGYQHVLVRQWMEDVFGEAADAWTRTSDLSPANPPTVNRSTSEAFAKLKPSDLNWAHGPPDLPKGQGSNWFVVDGKLSETGKPLLAGDPHLKVAIPDFWYQIGYRGALNVTVRKLPAPKAARGRF
jgi:penicillin amidase